MKNSPYLLTLLDYHWTRWYHNRTMRSLLCLSDEEYQRFIGELPIYSLLDPASPTYQGITPADRETYFAIRSQVFKRQFAGQEFDRWYLAIVEKIRRFPRAAEIWDNPPPEAAQQFLDSHNVCIYCPRLDRELYFRSQLNRLMRDPRFVVVELTCSNDETAQLLKMLRLIPDQGELTA